MPMKSIPKQPDWTLPSLYGSESYQLPPSSLVCGRCGKGAIPDVDVRAGGGISLRGKKKICSGIPCTCVLVQYHVPLLWIFNFR
jgi:hypothetical protein